MLINYYIYVCNKHAIAEYSFILFISYIVDNHFPTLNQQNAQYVVQFVGWVLENGYRIQLCFILKINWKALLLSLNVTIIMLATIIFCKSSSVRAGFFFTSRELTHMCIWQYECKLLWQWSKLSHIFPFAVFLHSTHIWSFQLLEAQGKHVSTHPEISLCSPFETISFICCK